MKIKEYIAFFSKAIFSAGLGLMALTSCSDEVSDFRETPDGETTVSFRIPDIENMKFRTRADDKTAPKTGSEGTIHTMRLFAFPKEEGKGAMLNLDLTDADHRSEGNYRVYTISIKPGDYHFYLFANIKRYVAEEDLGNYEGKIDESVLNGIVLDFSSTGHELLENHLPMAAYPNKDDMSVEDSQGWFTVNEGTNNQINVNLRFMCSKVRHTILFNNSSNGISKDFHNNIIEFIHEGATVENVKSQTILTALEEKGMAATSTDYLSWNLNLGLENRFKYPDHVGYPLDSADDLFIWDDEKDWSSYGEKAWQYVIYLPENLDDDNVTYLNHPYTISGVPVKNAHIYEFKGANKLHRAQMYDLVTEVVNSDFIDQYVKLKQEDWSLESLMYELHGPYELIVESTDVEIISTVRWTTMGFETDVEMENFKFEFPKIFLDGELKDFYYAEVIEEGMTDDNDHEYIFDSNWEQHLRIRVHPQIPYNVIKDLKEGEYEADNGEVYTQDKLKYFHIKAGNLHKRIDVSWLELEINLSVNPQTLIIDTRQFYTQGTDSRVGVDAIPISFSTNYIDDDISQRFFLTDHKDLFVGKGEREDVEAGDPQYVLQMQYDNNKFSSAGGNLYNINVSEGKLMLDVRDILAGNYFWTEDHEYLLTFSLKYDDSKDALEKSVRIIVKPFSSNYIIHFKDQTGTWKGIPHVFIYQDLLLPSDLPKYDFTTEEGRQKNLEDPGIHPYAGKIVGYIENFESINYNAATQYVFSNNISFRGWKGYGGPAINDPWEESTWNQSDDTNGGTMGFVMFGQQKSNKAWGDKYGYTNRADNEERHARYRYDVNFNDDHERRIPWKSIENLVVCPQCKARKDWGSRYSSSSYAGDDGYDYPGIQMEKETGENAGWWRYTLTGVAQPGKTMIIFADTETPWFGDGGQDAHRFPANYETGLRLFDFEDNEGWFVFYGQNPEGTTETTDPHFSDNKPNI